MQSSLRGIFIIIAPIAWLSLSCSVALPEGLTPDEETTETMMEAQGTYAVFLAFNYGTGTIEFISNTDVVNKAFTFSALPGSMFAGEAATLTASGVFNNSTNEWDLSASGSVGTSFWTSTGWAVDPPGDMHHEHEFPPTITIISDVFYTQTASQTVSEGTFTVRDYITGDVLSVSQHYDFRTLSGPNGSEWTWDNGSLVTPSDFKSIRSAGNSPVGGGPGGFTMTVKKVPEPSSVLLILTAFIFACGRAWKN